MDGHQLIKAGCIPGSPPVCFVISPVYTDRTGIKFYPAIFTRSPVRLGPPFHFLAPFGDMVWVWKIPPVNTGPSPTVIMMVKWSYNIHIIHFLAASESPFLWLETAWKKLFHKSDKGRRPVLLSNQHPWGGNICVTDSGSALTSPYSLSLFSKSCYRLANIDNQVVITKILKFSSFFNMLSKQPDLYIKSKECGFQLIYTGM